MLTKDLLNFRRRAGRIFPCWAPEDSPNLLELAAGMLQVFTEGAAAGATRGDIEELLTPMLQSGGPKSVAAGLSKLLFDRTRFETAGELDYRAARRERFERAAQLLAAAGGDLERYNRELGTTDFELYGDLPEFERTVGFREIDPVGLLRRYNVALVQGLLFYADSIELEITGADPAELRRLYRYLKFFRLLAEAQPVPDGLRFQISGPFALFENTRKYALQLAAFFPAIPLFRNWRLRATVRIGAEPAELRLDQDSNLRSHYRNFSAYVPEEIAMFYRLFKEKSPHWKIAADATILKLPGNRVAFPDFSFKRGRTMWHLELFHRWHGAQLRPRLEWLREKPKLKLLIGIDRAVADDNAFAALSAEFPALAPRMFRFRDFPGVDRVLTLLNAIGTPPAHR